MKHFIFFACFFLSDYTYSQSIVFVNQLQQNGQHDGSSWDNACTDLQQAIALAHENDAIWVASGTYFPTSGNDRTVSFVLKQGVRMYGGFLGTETLMEQRNWASNKTILSGDIGLPNVGADNSFHVLYCSGVDSTTIVDGFMITKAKAYELDESTHGRGGGILIEPSAGKYDTNPVIRNCTFEQNYALHGGAIFCNWNYKNLVNPIIVNCKFKHNRAQISSGAVYKSGPANPTRPFTMVDCVFEDNASLWQDGGAVYLALNGNLSIFKRCTFERDSSKSVGAGIFYSGFADPDAGGQLLLDSCYFINNYAQEGTGLGYTDVTGSPGFFTLNIDHCRFEGNQAPQGWGSAINCSGWGVNIIYNFYNTLFKDNQTTSYGAVFAHGDSIYFQVKNCQFINNHGYSTIPEYDYALSTGGGFVRGTIANCLFAKNIGGIHLGAGPEGNVMAKITHSTFFGNSRDIINKTWYPSYDTSDVYRNDCYISNCVFWEPESGILSMFNNFNTSDFSKYDFHIDYSMVSMIKEEALPGASEAYGDHIIFHPPNPFFVNAAEGDYRLQACSPAVNNGNNEETMSAVLEFDLDGETRIFNDTVDMGAYETQDSCFTIGTIEPSLVPGILLFPNPVYINQEFRVDLPETEFGKTSWELLDIMGRNIANGIIPESQSEELWIKAPGIPGIYVFRSQDPGGKLGKIVIVR